MSHPTHVPAPQPAARFAFAPGARGRRRFRPVIGVAVAGLAAAVMVGAATVDHDALWKVVNGLCVFDKTHLGTPAPCAEVDIREGEDKGTAVLKDLVGKTQFLLIPTRRVTGIEDPLVGEGALPNYWAAAWAARSFVAQSAGKDLAREDIGLAINGQGARSQSQLHIHIDCILPKLREDLAREADRIGTHWSDLRLFGQNYRVRRIDGETLSPDPFRLLTEDEKSGSLSNASLAVVGATFDGKPGFVLMAQTAPGGATHPEDLLDHNCALAQK